MYSPRTYYLADTDKLSEQKAKVAFPFLCSDLSCFDLKVVEEKLGTGEYSMVRVPRAREVIFFAALVSICCHFGWVGQHDNSMSLKVGQSLISSLPSTLLAALTCFPPLIKAPPQVSVVLC